MKLKVHSVFILCLLLMFSVSFIGCSKEGTAEKAGKKIDQGLDAAKDKFNEMTK